MAGQLGFRFPHLISAALAAKQLRLCAHARTACHACVLQPSRCVSYGSSACTVSMQKAQPGG